MESRKKSDSKSTTRKKRRSSKAVRNTNQKYRVEKKQPIKRVLTKNANIKLSFLHPSENCKVIDRNDPIQLKKLRQKFIQYTLDYVGVPYKREYSVYNYYPIYLDWWGLIRRVWLDLAPELGFTIGPWNQGYQIDTCPIVLKKEEMIPGDLIFYSATYYDKEK